MSMTRQRTVVAVPAAMVDQGLTWSTAGIIGEVAWLDQSRFAAATTDAARQGVTAQVGVFGEAPRLTSLTHYFAEVSDLAEVRVVWVRPTSADDEAVMERLADFIADTVREQTTRYFLDVVSPVDLNDTSIPTIPQGWRQVVVSPEDLPSPDSADAGWSTTVPAVHLHTALAVAGQMGGLGAIDWIGDGSSVTAVHAFSRLVTGGATAVAESESYLDTVLPTAHAADVHPTAFAVFDDPAEAVATAYEWILAAGEGALVFTEPPPSAFAPLPRVSLWAHLRNFWSCLVLLVWKFRLPTLRDIDPSLVEFADQGYAVDPPPVGDAPDTMDWAVLDAGLRRQLKAALQRESRDDGELPPTVVWQALTELSTSLVDGGALPEGYPAAEYLKHRLVLGPEWIGPAPESEPSVGEAADPVAAEAAAGAAAPGATPHPLSDSVRELKGEPSALVLDNALARVRVLLKGASAPLVEPESRVMRTANRLAREVNSRDQKAREEQREALPTGGASGPPVTLLDRLRATVLGSFLVARLHAERWRDAALAEVPDPRGSLKALVRRARVAAGLVVTIASLLVSLRRWKGDEVDQWTLDHWGWAVGNPRYYTLLAVGVVIALIVIVWRFARAFYAAMERVRRTLEVRSLLAARATAAYRQHRTLESADRILRRWCDLLGALYPTGSPPPERLRPVLPALPRSVRVADPSVDPVVVREQWVAPVAAPVGWRGRAVVDVAETALAGRPALRGSDLMRALWADQGLPGEPLARAASAVTTGLPWTAWRATEVARVAESVRSEFGRAEHVVPVDGAIAYPDEGWSGLDFLGAIGVASSYRPRTLKALQEEVTGRQVTRPILWSSEPLVPRSGGASAGSLEVAGDLASAAVRVMGVRFRPSPTGESPEAESIDRELGEGRVGGALRRPR